MKWVYWLYFCLFAVAMMCICTVFLMAQTSSITTKDQKAKEVMDRALNVLGGADKIGDIKSLVIRGNGVNAVFGPKGLCMEPEQVDTLTYKFEIRIQLPDNFIQINQFPTRTTYDGISRGKLITSSTVVLPSALLQNVPPELQHLATDEAQTWAMTSRINEEINYWSRFSIGMLAKTSLAPMILTSGSTSGVFTLTGLAPMMSTSGSIFEGFTPIKRDDLVDEIEFDSKTGYPSIVRYKVEGLDMCTKNTPTGIPERLPSYLVDAEMRFIDRFSVNGIMFPRIIALTAPLRMNRKMLIEDVVINPELSQKDFQIPE